MSKIIFLDFDGVLNSQLWYVRTKGSRGRDDLDPQAIEFLNNLIEKTGAEVVVTSTWRLNRTAEELQDILNRNGFKGTVIDKTESFGRPCLRGNEIHQWMLDNVQKIGCYYSDYKQYVIIDDDSDMLYWHRNNLILVDGYVGLTPTNVYKATKILNN